MSLSREQRIFTKHISELIEFAYSLDIELTFGDAFRTPEQQKIYYDSGLSKTLNSQHNKRLAVDFNFFINGQLVYEKEKLECLGIFWETLDDKNRWGGHFKNFIDTPHFERKG